MGGNAFWEYLRQEYEKERKRNLEILGKSEALTETEMKISQGKNIAFINVQRFPATLVNRLEKELKNIGG